MLAHSRASEPSLAKSSVSRAARLCKPGVAGSNPVTSTNFFSDCKTLTEFISSPTPRFSCTLCTNCARMGLLQRDCAHWSRHQSVSGRRCYLIGSTVELFQGFALHLRILLEDLRIALAKHLGYPLIGYAASTQPRGISGTQVVNPKVGNLCASKCSAGNCRRDRVDEDRSSNGVYLLRSASVKLVSWSLAESRFRKVRRRGSLW